MYVNESIESMIQNLKDAGCDPEMIQKVIEDLQTGNETNGLKRLAVHRKNLLHSPHRQQKCIDCLDYLVYQMKKTKNK